MNRQVMHRVPEDIACCHYLIPLLLFFFYQSPLSFLSISTVTINTAPLEITEVACIKHSSK
ncbi:hypothetical protein DM01DRAFT_1134643 [Hesseltinella vesiculosa]|uniref:Uncharacterized protein n=1 Tax=Hesseltinella vesiculosa TaxID=101127 RepID=A0A1X2GA02_9FUNG|nr:hypothetical protein DM01DRAFT_1134643 [Hesseltinella vesiculosa]